jgi:flagellar basal body-associated protein FliL
MMDGGAWMMPGMMWGMGLLWLLLVVVLVVAAAALVKYLFFEGRRGRDG